MENSENLLGENRQLSEIPTENQLFPEKLDENQESSQAICKFLRDDLIGANVNFKGPFGARKVFYCDYTASGRALKSIENYINAEVLPLYGNTHSSVSVTAEQSTLFLHEARQIIRDSTQASEHDAILYCGSGTTSAVHVLIHALNLQEKPIVFVGPFEHHSNLLPWTETAEKVIKIKENGLGELDLSDLKARLAEHAGSSRPLIGCFSAASNITGVITNADDVTALLHSYGALSLWDYAAGAAYLSINMNPAGRPEARKDAIFFSGHKLPGAVRSPGVLIAKKSLFRNRVPFKPGGGTVFFVRRDCHTYLKEIEYREEGGTVDIVGAVRLGLAVKLKLSIGCKFISTWDSAVVSYVSERFSRISNLVVLGPDTSNRIPIFSFVIKHKLLYLHHNFVCALLDNLFGIQSRAGCACAGPHGLELLGIDESLAERFDKILREEETLDREQLRRKGQYSSYEMLRPGFTRLNFSYFFTKSDVDFIIDCISFVAENGWKFLPQYLVNPESGEWHHVDQKVFTDRKWLGHVNFTPNGMDYRIPKIFGNPPDSYEECLKEAQRLAELTSETARRLTVPDLYSLFTGEPGELRWFLLSQEAKDQLLSQTPILPPAKAPFEPKIYSANVSEKYNSDILEIPDPEVHNGASNENEVEIECEKLETEKSEKQEPSCSIKEDWSRRKVVLAKAEHDLKPQTKLKWVVPPSNLFKLMCKAISEHGMFKNGDRVLVCLSGGKDSLSLLHALKQYQHYARRKEDIEFEIGAITVDPGSDAYDPSPLIGYLAALNVTYLYEEQRILSQAKSLAECASICSFCSRMKRGRIYAAARKYGWNVLAFGQHLDDLVESFFMSAFQNGSLRTMKAHYTVKEGDLRVVRPLVYVREKQLRDFAESNKLPVIPENCPACFEVPKERHRVKQMLGCEEALFPNLFHKLRSAISPLMAVQAVTTAQANQQAVNNINLDRMTLENSETDSDNE